MKSAENEVTVAHPAVIETRPASTPLHTALTSHTSEPMLLSRRMTVMPPPAPARVVVTHARAAVLP